MTEMVIADFDSSSVAEAAIRDLENAQIPSAAIKSYSKDEESTQTHEYGAYDTSLASGHTVVTVMVDELHAEAVMGILNQHGPRDLHEQASGGSETYQTGAYPAARTASTSRVNGGKDEEEEEEVIPLAEEELQDRERPDPLHTGSVLGHAECVEDRSRPVLRHHLCDLQDLLGRNAGDLLAHLRRVP